MICCVFRIVTLMRYLLLSEESGRKSNVENKSRFQEEFGPSSAPLQEHKPKDWQSTFRGNTDDAFFLGVAVTKKSLKVTIT